MSNNSDRNEVTKWYRARRDYNKAVKEWEKRGEAENPFPLFVPQGISPQEYANRRYSLLEGRKFDKLTLKEIHRIRTQDFFYSKHFDWSDKMQVECESQRRAWSVRDLWEARQQAILDAPYDEI